MLENDPHFFSANIYMQPPDNGNDTDEDSGSEDSGGNMDNLTGRQLRAGAVATIISSDHSKTVIGDVESDESETETSKAISSQNEYNWRSADRARTTAAEKRQTGIDQCRY